jgi:replicative DNA helicase
MRTMRDRASGKVRPVPLRLFPEHGNPTAWRAAEVALGGGLWPGLWMLVGPTGTGKTQLAMALALGAALEGCPVAYVGLELDDVGIVARLLGLPSGRWWSSLYLGIHKDREGGPMIDEPAVRAVEKVLEDLPWLHVEGDPMGWAPDRLADVAAELVELAASRGIDTKKRPPLIVLDFLQLVGDPDGAERPLDVRQRMQRAAYQARDVARRLGVAVLAVSSTSRENAKQLRKAAGDELPYAADLVGTGKESGEIEYSADGVLVLVSHDDDEGPERLVSVAVAKVRAGRTGWLHLSFRGDRHREATPGEVERAEAVHVAELDDDAQLVAGKVEDVTERIEGIDDPNRLEAALKCEAKRRTPRKGVKDAIAARLYQLRNPGAASEGSKAKKGKEASFGR